MPTNTSTTTTLPGLLGLPKRTAPTGHLASSWLQQLCPLRSRTFKGSTHRWVRGRRQESLLVDDHTTRTAALWCCPATRHHPLLLCCAHSSRASQDYSSNFFRLASETLCGPPFLTLMRWSPASSRAQEQPGSWDWEIETAAFLR